MTRWQPNARDRLAAAALELYAERGFEGTTVAEIAARAGLTERTFFRHFADKREVLFAGSELLEMAMVRAVADAAPDASPMAAVGAALDAAAAMLQAREAHGRRRFAVISATPELHERELIKMTRLAGSLATALRARGVPEPAATLAAEAGMAVFRVAYERWITGPKRTRFATVVHAALADLRTVAAG